jgi:hypothetical protein
VFEGGGGASLMVGEAFVVGDWWLLGCDCVEL